MTELQEQNRPHGIRATRSLGAIPAVMNAVNDALARVGAPAIEMPAAAEKVWRAIRTAQDGTAAT